VAAAVGTDIRRAVDAVGTSFKCWILAVAASTLDSTLAARFGTMDTVDTVGTSSRRVADIVGTSSRRAADIVGTSSRRVRSGMISIFSNYRLRITFFCQYHASLVKYSFLSSYRAKSKIYVVFRDFYDHLTCLYLCLRDFGLTARRLGRRRVRPNDA
jgi:hypothetical protein